MRKYVQHLLTVSVALLALQFAIPAFAQRTTLELDPARTAVHFTLRTSLHTVHGTFRLKGGKVSFDPLTGKASGLLAVDAASGESGNRGRDAKMHKEVLESHIYPEITFVPLEVKGGIEMQGDSQVQVTGTFSLHGQDHEVVINFSVPYISWGLKNPSTFILRASDTVQLSVHSTGQWTRDVTN